MNKKLYRIILSYVLFASVLFLVFYVYENTGVNKGPQISVSNEQVNADNIEEKYVMPLGKTEGIYLSSEGVLVVQIDKATGCDGLIYEPARDILRPGDYIISIDNNKVLSKEHMLSLINMCTEDEALLDVKRNGNMIKLRVKLVEDKDGIKRIGVWVKDDIQGIGTVTYVDEERRFAALGHGIEENDTRQLLNIDGGTLYKCNIWGITKGTKGKPGGLCGTINYRDEFVIGNITENTDCGIFGYVNYNFLAENKDLKKMPIAGKEEVKCDSATIMCEIDNVVDNYNVEIVDVRTDSKREKQIEFKVTDQRLIKSTGGIVQGLSGSPIIQNGKIVGAVTHVFVEDPTKGYGIFIEEMVEEKK